MYSKSPISEETKKRLSTTIESKLIEVTQGVDDIRTLMKKTESLESYINNYTFEINFSNQKRLLEYRMLIGLLYLDLIAAIRIYLNSKYKYEALFSARQVIVIITEGFKQIYHFKQSERLNSFWGKDIKTIIDADLVSLKSEYEKITKSIQNFESQYYNTLKIKEQRDLSVHYDKKPSKVYDMILSLDIEDVYKYMIPFLDILKEMYDFTNKIVVNYQIKCKIESEQKLQSFNKLSSEIIEKARALNLDNETTLMFEKLLNDINQFMTKK